jgi:hypothetical protein
MKKKQIKEIEESEVMEDNLPPEEEPSDSGESKQEEAYLTQREKLYVWVTVLSSFLFFTILFLPYGLFTKKIINSIIKPIAIDYTELDYNFFQQNMVFNAVIDLSGNNIIKADQMGFDISLLSYLKGGFSGSLQMVNPDLIYSGSSIKARTVNAEVDLDDIHNLKVSNGKIKFISSQMEILSLNIRTIPIPLENITVSGMMITAVIKNGTVTLDGSKIKVDAFDVIATGTIQLNQSLNTSVLNLKVCINPITGSNLDNSNLYGMYLAAGGKSDSSLCFQVTGSPVSPSFVKQQ